MELNESDEWGDRATPRTFPGRLLKRMRERNNLSQRALATDIHYPHSYISRVERHEQLPSKGLTDALDKHFDADGLFNDSLVMAQDALATEYGPDYLSHEKECVRLQVFTSSLVPGLLQTEGYARAMFSSGLSRYELPALEQHVQKRLRRQQLLQKENAPHYWAIMDETALKRPSPNRDVMARQLRHLLEVLEWENIRIQVLPFDQAFHPFLGGSLTLLTMENGATKALVESYGSGKLVDAPRQVVDLVERFDVARAQALPVAESATLIRRYLEGYTRC